MALSAIGTAVLAGAVTALATPLAIRLAVRTGVVDHPGLLKPHDRPVPYLGGVAVFGGIVAATVGSGHPGVLLPLVLATGLGLLDDVARLPVVLRLVVEVGIGVAVAWATGPFGPMSTAGIALATVLLINAVNMVDGIDGLALGMCAVTALGFALLAPAGWTPFAAAVTGSAVGLLVFNRPPARIYLGDAGSYLLGTAVAVLVGVQWSAVDGVPDVAVLGALVGYIWVELVSTVGRRLLSRRPLFGGDRDHVYDRLERAGAGKARVTGLLVAAQAAVVGLAVASQFLGAAALSLVLVALLAVGAVGAALPVRSERA